jgi:Protein of unknown function (DUF3644)
MVEASRDEASLAVRLYNDATDIRSFEGFVVHMHLAWLYLLYAEFTRDKIDYRYWQRDNPRRLERVDGEPKQWELARSVRERWPDPRNPVRANLDLFIGLRNKVEYRYARDHAALAAAVSGQAQAMLLNYEKELTDQFGIASSLATRLRFPVLSGPSRARVRRPYRSFESACRLRYASSSPSTTRSWVRPLQTTPAMNSGYESSRSLPQGPGRSRDPVHPLRRFDR